MTVEGEGIVELPENRSKAEVKIEALFKAKINAKEKAFGTSDAVGSMNNLTDKSNGKITETKFVFSTISNSFVRAEIIEIIDENYEEIQGKAEFSKIIKGVSKTITVIKCSIRCKVREIPDGAPNFETYTLNRPEPDRAATKFKQNDQFFLYFKSTADGYLIVFIEDDISSQCILPYRNMERKYNVGVPIMAGHGYIFFSNKKEFNYFEDINCIDELELTADSGSDHYRVFVLFSRNPISVPELKPGKEKDLLSEEEINKQYQAPLELEFKEFNKWLTKARNLDRELRLKTIDIIVQPARQ